ncbi:MAG: hypothetical protein WCG47_09910 [Dermatophilaceae bacterium]
MRQDIRAFLDAFERASDPVDPDALRPLFAETFMNLAPGAASALDREAFLGALGARRVMFDAIDATSMELADAWETPLDDAHSWLETRWTVNFSERAPADRQLTLASAFLLQRHEGAWRVTVYLNHQDLPAVIRSLTGPA